MLFHQYPGKRRFQTYFLLAFLQVDVAVVINIVDETYMDQQVEEEIAELIKIGFMGQYLDGEESKDEIWKPSGFSRLSETSFDIITSKDK